MFEISCCLRDLFVRLSARAPQNALGLKGAEEEVTLLIMIHITGDTLFHLTLTRSLNYMRLLFFFG